MHIVSSTQIPFGEIPSTFLNNVFIANSLHTLFRFNTNYLISISFIITFAFMFFCVDVF